MAIKRWVALCAVMGCLLAPGQAQSVTNDASRMTRRAAGATGAGAPTKWAGGWASRVIRHASYFTGQAAGELFVPAVVPAGGDADPQSIDELLTAMRREHPGGPQAIVVMVHGFDTRRVEAHKFYGRVAGRMRARLDPASTAIIGLYWESDPGPARKWIGQALAHRVLKAVGLGRRARDPYFTISCDE